MAIYGEISKKLRIRNFPGNKPLVISYPLYLETGNDKYQGINSFVSLLLLILSSTLTA
jgi:hypothetical protein